MTTGQPRPVNALVAYRPTPNEAPVTMTTGFSYCGTGRDSPSERGAPAASALRQNDGEDEVLRCHILTRAGFSPTGGFGRAGKPSQDGGFLV